MSKKEELINNEDRLTIKSILKNRLLLLIVHLKIMNMNLITYLKRLNCLYYKL